MPPEQQEILVELRLAVARLDEQVKAIDKKIDSNVVSREHFEERLAPLMENMNKWKGGMAAIIFISGSIGAIITTFAKHLFGSTQ